MYTNYANGVQNGSAGAFGSQYNLLISGKTDYTGSTGFMVKNDTTISDGQSHRGFIMKQDSSDNSYFDFRTQAGGVKNLTFTLQDDANPNDKYPMMILTDDGNIVSQTTYGMIISGRMNASQYYVGQADTRPVNSPGVYLGFNNDTTGYFNINKGSGTGGFNFQTYDKNGALTQTNLAMNAAGTVQVPYDQATGATQDNETTAMMVFDATGNVVRSYQQNARFRNIETRVGTLETETVVQVPQKVNEIISRLNTLKVWNTAIGNITLPQPSP